MAADLQCITPPQSPDVYLPPGYKAIFYGSGLDVAAFYVLYVPTDDSLRTNPPYSSGIGAYIDGNDSTTGFTFTANTLGYGYISVTTVASLPDPDGQLAYLLHYPSGLGSKKGAATIDGFVAPPPDNRLTGVAGVGFQTGAGVGPAMVTMTTIAATPGDTAVEIGWTDAANDAGVGTVNYRVQRSTSPVGPFSNRPGTTASLSYLDTGLTNGTTYYYRVQGAVNLGSGEFLNGGTQSSSPGTFSTDYLSNIVSATPSASVTQILSLDGIAL